MLTDEMKAAGVDELVGRLRTEYFSQWHSGDARKAADTIEALAAQLAEARAENERLREALIDVLVYAPDYMHGMPKKHYEKIARGKQ